MVLDRLDPEIRLRTFSTNSDVVIELISRPSLS